MGFVIHEQDSLVIINLLDEGIGDHHAAQLPQEIEQFADAGKKRIVVSLDRRTEPHSEVIGLLIKCARLAAQRGARLAVVHPDEEFHSVVKMCRLDRAVVFAASVEELAGPTTVWPEVSQETEDDTVGGEIPKHVLLVDDHPRVLEGTREVLYFFKYDVTMARDGQEALELFRAQHDGIGAVLMDVDMPRLNGIDAFRAMREIDPNARIILMSGNPIENQAEKLMEEEGLVAFVRKPFTVSRLQGALLKAFTQTPV